MSVVEIYVACPDCGDVNRAARRGCMKGRGMCNGTGRVAKNVPVQSPSVPDPEAPIRRAGAMFSENEARRLRP